MPSSSTSAVCSWTGTRDTSMARASRTLVVWRRSCPRCALCPGTRNTTSEFPSARLFRRWSATSQIGRTRSGPGKTASRRCEAVPSPAALRFWLLFAQPTTWCRSTRRPTGLRPSEARQDRVPVPLRPDPRIDALHRRQPSQRQGGVREGPRRLPLHTCYRLARLLKDLGLIS